MSSKPNPTTSFGGIVVGGNPNEYAPGTLHIASENTVLREQDRLESRRGLYRLQQLAGGGDRLFAWKSYIFARTLNGNLVRLEPPDYTGAPIFSTGGAQNFLTLPYLRKIRAQPTGDDRLFFTSSDGLRVLDTPNTNSKRVGFLGPFVSGPAPTGTGTALPSQMRAAYRAVLVRRTAAGLQVFGPPGGRGVATNTTGTTQDVFMQIYLPTGLNTQEFFIQVYRSSYAPNQPLPVEPDDDLKLIYEAPLTQFQVTNRVIGFIDTVPEALRGEYLYTSPNAGEGIQGANTPPPIAEDITLHKSRLWLAVTTQPQSLDLQLLGVAGMANGETLTFGIAGPGATFDISFSATTGGSASQNVAGTAQGVAGLINSTPANTWLWAEYVSAPDDSPGMIRIYVRPEMNSVVFGFSVSAKQRSTTLGWSSRKSWIPALAATPAIPFTLSRTGTTVTATWAGSGNIAGFLDVGDQFTIEPASPPNFGKGPFTVTGVTSTTITYTEAGPATSLPAQQLIPVAATAQSEGVRHANRIYYSKFSEYEAFPEQNYFDVGAGNAEIISIRATRDVLWIFKQDGLFRLTGDDEDSFDVERVDSTIIAMNPECVKAYAEGIVAWTKNGVLLIDESNVTRLSDDIDALLRAYVTDPAIVDVYSDPDYHVRQAFIVVDETERIIRLHLAGDSIDINDNIVGSGHALIYSVATQRWTRWNWPLNTALDTSYKPFRDGIVNPYDGRAYYVDVFDIDNTAGFAWTELNNAETPFSDADYSTPSVKTFRYRRRALFSWNVLKAPLADKRFDEVALLWGRRYLNTGQLPTIFAYGFGTELSETTQVLQCFGMLSLSFRMPSSSIYTADVPTELVTRIAIPRDFARGQRLWIGVESVDTGFAQEFTLYGFNLLAEVLNGNISR